MEFSLDRTLYKIMLNDDGGTDYVCGLQQLKRKTLGLSPVRNTVKCGFGHTITFSLAHEAGDVVVIMLANGSGDAYRMVRYRKLLNENQNWDYSSESRFIKNCGVIM